MAYEQEYQKQLLMDRITKLEYTVQLLLKRIESLEYNTAQMTEFILGREK